MPLIPPQDDVIEEISKLSLQGGLEQAVNLLAASRSWTAFRIRSHFEFNLACVKCLKHQTHVNISVAVRSIRNRKNEETMKSRIYESQFEYFIVSCFAKDSHPRRFYEPGGSKYNQVHPAG